MVCNLTIGKKKYINSEEELKVIKDRLIKAKAEFLALSIEDNKAFDKVMEAYKLPKENEEQRSIRVQKIEETTIYAGLIPFRVISLCKSIIPAIMVIGEKGNQNSLSDTGVAFSLISTSAQGAYLNVLINLAVYRDLSDVKDVLEKAGIEFREIKEKCRMGIELIEKNLSV
jgi:formiminotetrahydrofolate cyclodeaminase